MKKFTLLFCAVAIISCGVPYARQMHAPITEEEKYLLANPPAGTVVAAERHIPENREFTLKAEAMALKNGRELTAFEHGLAVKAGVKHPEKIRIWATDQFPFEEELSAFRPITVGLTVRYGVYMRPFLSGDGPAYFEILAHEFVHVRQFENLGIDGMSRRFFIETTILQEKLNLLEREAIADGNKVYDDPDTVYGF